VLLAQAVASRLAAQASSGVDDPDDPYGGIGANGAVQADNVVSADLLSGQNVTVSTGPLVTGVLASAAIPGVLPPVLREGRYLIDGGVAHQTGVTQAVGLGATLIYVLPAGTPCALPAPPASAIGTAVHALTLLIEQRLAREVAELAGAATIKVLPPLCPLRTSAADFAHGADPIDRARQSSLDWIATGNIDLPAPEQFLATHRHRSPAPVTERRTTTSVVATRSG
jgi:NTE family protein